MNLLAGNDLWPLIFRLAQSSVRRWVAVSYVSDAVRLAFQPNDRLIVNASDESVISGATSAQELQRLYRLGVRLYSKANLHSKLYLFDDDVVVGSCNLSKNSLAFLFEVGIHASGKDQRLSAERVIEDLTANSIEIDNNFIERILTLRITPIPACPTPEPTANLWRLKRPPVALSKMMKCYMQALIEAQLGGLIQGKEFYLWPGSNGSEPFRAHMLPQADRIRGGQGRYTLTREGVEYFGKRKLDASVVGQLLAAVQSGREEDLPPSLVDRDLVPL